MTPFDLSPLFRSTVGFDRLSRLIDASFDAGDGASYPPYNIEKLDDDQYRITMAVAGFGEDELDIVEQEGTLVVTAKGRDENKDGHYLHRGIAARAFQRRFALAEHVYVVAANLENGLLHIDLERKLPDAMKPRNIPILRHGQTDRLVGKKAA
ncbi:MAG: Hsp20 family protein [Alphaproteobacteria bacterium]|nr:Hsp20 family protein [Alphaproteobacteria bacterium]MCZ6765068.1 Hsp20 family protein [Alphaproteobacteria bacterium]